MTRRTSVKVANRVADARDPSVFVDKNHPYLVLDVYKLGFLQNKSFFHEKQFKTTKFHALQFICSNDNTWISIFLSQGFEFLLVLQLKTLFFFLTASMPGPNVNTCHLFSLLPLVWDSGV